MLIVYGALSYFDVVELCHCIKMDLAAPRSMEEAQEIDRRGELKYDYFTNYVRIRTVFTYIIYYSSCIWYDSNMYKTCMK